MANQATELIGHLDHVHETSIESEHVDGALGLLDDVHEHALELGVIEEVPIVIVVGDGPQPNRRIEGGAE